MPSDNHRRWITVEVAEMRRQVDRIRRDHSADPEAAIGQAKELIETVCKTILGITGDTAEDVRPKFPQLVKRTMLHIGIDPTQVGDGSGDPVQMRASKQVLGGISAVLNGADELRNARGTGHGRSRSPLVNDALARLTVGAALPAAIYLIEIYESRTKGERATDLLERPTPSGIEVGTVVRHETYGEGQVTDASGTGADLVIVVDFGGDLGTKRLLVRYARLTVVR